MKNFAIACIACLALTTLQDQVQGVEYHLAKFLDNSDIPDTTQGATVALTLSEANELEFTASHLLFGGHSPTEASLAIGTCQQRPFDNLYDYESVDLFFANDNGEYLEVTVNPDGRYYVALHASKTEPIAGDNTATKDEASSPILRLLRLDDVHSGEKCPLRNQEQCVWNTRVVIPRDYLPLDVTMFNAYATHGSGGEGAELLREALFTSANETTFHNLDNFGPISLWTELNYTENTEMSPLWSKALSDHQNFDSLVQTIEFDSECGTYANPDRTDISVSYEKATSQSATHFTFHVDTTNSEPEPPNSELNFDDESLWFTFTGTPADGQPEQLRVAVSPAGKTSVHLFKNGQDISLRAYELNQVSCDVGNTHGNWECTISVPWHYLPVGVTHHQIIHRHPLLAGNSSIFTGYSCPGAADIDFWGCPIDRALITSEEGNSQDSDYWAYAKEANRATDPPSQSGSQSISAFTSLYAVAALSMAFLSVAFGRV